MKEILVDLKDMSDSKEFMNANPKSFIRVFIYIILLVLIIALLWSYYSEIEIYVTANGIVKTEEDVSTVNNMITGKINEVYIEEGTIVSRGDILFEVDIEDIDFAISQYKIEIAKVKDEQKNLNKQKDSILANRNLFDVNNSDEEYYYYAVEKYFSDIEVYNNSNDKEKHSLRTNKELAIIQLNKANQDMVDYELKLDSAKLYVQSINDGINLFDINLGNENYIKFENYQNSLDVLKNNVKIIEDKLNSEKILLDVGAIAQYEYDITLNAFNEAKATLEQFILTEKNIAEANLNAIKNTYSTLSSNISNLEKQVELYSIQSTDISSTLYQNKVNLLTQLEQQIKGNNAVIEELEKNISELQLNAGRAIVRAERDGVVSMNTTLQKGDLVLSNTTVATIVPQSENGYVVELYVSNKDISSVELDQEIKLKVLALPYQNYGVISSKVISISPDIKYSQDLGESYYLVKCRVEEKTIQSYSGEEKELMVGMAVEGNFVKNREKVLLWFLDKINIIDLKID